MNQLDSIIKVHVADRESPAPRITCADGESVSIQASKFTYCSPRDDFAPWSEVEAGFPSCTPPDSWQKYAEEWEGEPSPGTETVYGWLPIELVTEFIKAHGGEK